jgi:hypothetical protein
VANKTLSQVIGASNHEIGDIIETKATSLADGRVLLPCDGTVISAVTYPDLAALLPDSVAFSPPEARYSADGSSLHSNIPIVGEYQPTVPLPFCGGAARTIAMDNGDDIWLQDATDATEVQTVGTLFEMGFPVCSADANEVMVAYIGSGSAYDLKMYYTITGGDPTNTLTITTAGAFGAAGATPVSLINAAGNDAKIIVWETGSSTIDTWTNGGTDIATGWTETSSIAWTTGAGAFPTTGNYGYSDDLQTIAIPRTLNGAIISTNGGTTWTQDVLINGRSLPYSMSVSTNDTVFAIQKAASGDGGEEPDAVFSTTDSGTTWTKSLTAHDMRLLVSPEYESVQIEQLLNDKAGRIYCMAALLRTALNSNQTRIAKQDNGCFYSEDNGTTWSFTVVPMSSAYTADSMDSGFTGWGISKDDLKMYFSGTVSSNYFAVESALTHGTALPYRPGFKIVADAP